MNSILTLTHPKLNLDVLFGKIFSFLDADEIGSISSTSVSTYLAIKKNEPIWQEMARRLFIPTRFAPTWREVVLAIKRLQKGLFVESSVYLGLGTINGFNLLHAGPKFNFCFNHQIKVWKPGQEIQVTRMSREETLENFDGERYLFKEVIAGTTRIVITDPRFTVQNDFIVAEEGMFILLGKYLFSASNIYTLPTHFTNAPIAPTHQTQGTTVSVHGFTIWFYGPNKITLFDTSTGNIKVLNFAPIPDLISIMCIQQGLLVCFTRTHRIGYKILGETGNANVSIAATATFEEMFQQIWKHPLNGTSQLWPPAEQGSGFFVGFNVGTQIFKFYNALTGLLMGEMEKPNAGSFVRIITSFTTNQSIQLLNSTTNQFILRSFATVEPDVIKNLRPRTVSPVNTTILSPVSSQTSQTPSITQQPQVVATPVKKIWKSSKMIMAFAAGIFLLLAALTWHQGWFLK